MAVLDSISRQLAPAVRRLRTLIQRGNMTATDDSQALQLVDLEVLGEAREQVQRVGEYGFTSRPKVGAEVVIVSPGGDWARAIVIATDDRRTRPRDLKEGEAAMWTSDHGVRVLCAADGKVDLGTSPSDFVALAPAVKAELDAIKADLDAIVEWCGMHQHNSTAPGSPTTPPIPVPATAPAAGSGPSITWSPAEVAAEEVKAK